MGLSGALARCAPRHEAKLVAYSTSLSEAMRHVWSLLHVSSDVTFEHVLIVTAMWQTCPKPRLGTCESEGILLVPGTGRNSIVPELFNNSLMWLLVAAT